MIAKVDTKETKEQRLLLLRAQHFTALKAGHAAQIEVSRFNLLLAEFCEEYNTDPLALGFGEKAK